MSSYLISSLLGLGVAIQGILSAIVSGNIVHVHHGRQPNAGACIFPTIVVMPLFCMGMLWVLKHFFSHHAIWHLVIGFILLSSGWAVSYRRQLKELEAALRESKSRSA